MQIKPAALRALASDTVILASEVRDLRLMLHGN